MQITGQPFVQVQNYVLNGFYSQSINNGVRPKLYEFSSPTYGVDKFNAPFDAILPAPTDATTLITGVGRRIRSQADIASISAERTGKLYFSDHVELYGTCHGFGRDVDTFYKGYNFYQAFYPAGYFSPPYGENLSIFKSNQDGSENLYNGACATMSATEYNEAFGIVSVAAGDISLTTNYLTANQYAPIYSPTEVCPPDVAITNYYDELNFHQIQGTTTQLGGGTFYNGNPIPTSLDIYNLKLNSRYYITGSEDNRFIVYHKTGTNKFKPQASYSPNNQENMLNNTLCLAGVMEDGVMAGRGSNNTQMVQAPDILYSNIGGQVSVAGGLDTAFNYWHFTFQENSDSLPFDNNFSAITATATEHHRTLNQGTQLFMPVLSSADSYWQNRQCPDTVDFLPWTFGASIYACPSYHFDVPYYAATKKFGFYGTRFLNTCNKTVLSNKWNGVDNAIELPASATDVNIPKGQVEPDGIDGAGSFSFAAYDNLLKTAKAEERYSNMYALNKGFFLWANLPWYQQDSSYLQLLQLSGFSSAFSGLVGQFQSMFTGGLSSFISGEPAIIMQAGVAGAKYVGDSNRYNDLLFSNKPYNDFVNSMGDYFPSSGKAYLDDLTNRYGSFIVDGNGQVNEDFYTHILTGREQRVMTRYMENTIQGNPVDLFPLNHISFSFDKAQDYLEHPEWGRSLGGFKKTQLPEIPQRFFEGAYGNASQITGLAQTINALNFSDNTAFYPGFFNDINVNKDLPSPSYIPVSSGIIIDKQKRKFSPSGWLALGYNEIGKLDGNFSCFTPIFIQHPTDKVFTKIGQAPTFHANAVDYHTIPDDKLSARYPEVLYWAYKLKMVDKQFKNLYPLTYRWLRVPKTQYTNFLTSGLMLNGDFASATGSWGCLEGNSQDCTLCHPTESLPTGLLSAQSDYTFLKGAKKGEDDQYYYMCLASGRFGIRLSEKSELAIEDWVRFDVSLKLGVNQAMPLSLSFIVNDKNGINQQIDFTSSSNSAYMGYQQDVYAIPEAVVEAKVPPPNAGYGDVSAYKFVGPIGYVGATRSYQPDTLKDTRGLREAWGRFIEYGSLVSLSKTLNQTEGDLLYGYQHLPKCVNYSMPNGQKGVKVIGKLGNYFISHWTLDQKAVAATDTTVGMPWKSLTNLGALYPPITSRNLPQSDPIIGGYAIGQWQWGSNLGTIKRFGYLSTPKSQDIVFTGPGAPSTFSTTQKQINDVKKQVLVGSDLAGSNCGYSPLGLGRNMLYYLEAYDRFYVLCDNLKKKNVRSLSFICPGLRATNSAIQYCWLGHPSNTYLERRPMYGPYAYQWKVKRHNRDRNGNGMSEGFYSMGWSQRYSLMYDAPAVYGLYVKRGASQIYKNMVKDVATARAAVFGQSIDLTSLRGIWFGVGGSEGGYRRYGNMFCASDSNGDNPLCDYIAKAQSFGTSLDFQSYGCSESQLAAGQCFDPCLSIRYGQGFLAGGKAQDLFGYNPSNSLNVNQNKSLRLVATSNQKSDGSLITSDEKSVLDPNTYFRSPVNTPHARVWRGLSSIKGSTARNSENIVGMSPCKDGGTDHCNFTTPTVHLNTSTVLLTSSSSFVVAKNYAANLFESYNIRGDNS